MAGCGFCLPLPPRNAKWWEIISGEGQWQGKRKRGDRSWKEGEGCWRTARDERRKREKERKERVRRGGRARCATVTAVKRDSSAGHTGWLQSQTQKDEKCGEACQKSWQIWLMLMTMLLMLMLMLMLMPSFKVRGDEIFPGVCICRFLAIICRNS